MHVMHVGLSQNESGVIADQATFKGLLSLWSPKIILVCSYSYPCQDVFGPVCGHILHSCVHNGLQDAQSTSLYSKASHALCTCARPNMLLHNEGVTGCNYKGLESLSIVLDNDGTAQCPVKLWEN